MKKIALISIIAGAVLSLYFMFKAGSEQKSILLILLFTGWVLSPFVGLILAERRWSNVAPSLVHWLSLIVTICSIVAYSGILKVPNAKPAFIFLVVPFTSWLIIILTYILVRSKSKNHS